jgi:hypothetical protein
MIVERQPIRSGPSRPVDRLVISGSAVILAHAVQWLFLKTRPASECGFAEGLTLLPVED